MPDSDKSPSARRKRAPEPPSADATADDTAPAEADEAVADRDRRAELERLRHRLHRKFH